MDERHGLEQTMTSSQIEANNTGDLELEKRLGTGAWGLVLIWIGVSIFRNIDGGVVLLVLGLIALAAQAARKNLGVRIDGFGLALGAFLTIVGVMEVWNARFADAAFFPILSIILGAIFLISALLRRRQRGLR
jgi:hypothetical protein